MTPQEDLLLVLPISLPDQQRRLLPTLRAHRFPPGHRERLQRISQEDEDPRRRRDAEILLLYVDTGSLRHAVNVTGCERNYVEHLVRSVLVHGVDWIEQRSMRPTSGRGLV